MTSMLGDSNRNWNKIKDLTDRVTKELIRKPKKNEYENPKPEINLQSTKTVIDIQNEEEFNTLMRIYEFAGWTWASGTLPTEFSWTGQYICGNNKKLTYIAKRDFDLVKINLRIISIEEFYQLQGIKPELITQINDWFAKNQTK
ncbi:MAG: hypothetical protein ACOYT4_05115 [Nanoarchaeota archaeon]